MNSKREKIKKIIVDTIIMIGLLTLMAVYIIRLADKTDASEETPTPSTHESVESDNSSEQEPEQDAASEDTDTPSVTPVVSQEEMPTDTSKEDTQATPAVQTNTDDNSHDTNKSSSQAEVSDTAEGSKSFTLITTILDEQAEKEKKNTVLSSLSLDMALGMLAEGADETSKKDFESYYGTSIEEVTEKNHELIEDYNNLESVTVNLSNAIYLNSLTDFKITDDYKEKVQTKYDADVESLKFGTQKAIDKVNKFCEDHTAGKITKMVNKLTMPEAASMILLNATYFNAKWEDDPKTADGIFRDNTGKEIEVSMLRDYLCNYYETETAQAFSKDYKGGRFTFFGVLPKESITSENGDFKVSDIDLVELLCSPNKEYKANVEFPEFETEDTNELIDYFIKSSDRTPILNLTSQEKTFGNINGDFAAPPTVDGIHQKTYVKVSETGTEAAAVTDISMSANSLEPMAVAFKEIILDRPFMFMIYDQYKNECLFIGKILTIE